MAAGLDDADDDDGDDGGPEENAGGDEEPIGEVGEHLEVVVEDFLQAVEEAVGAKQECEGKNVPEHQALLFGAQWLALLYLLVSSLGGNAFGDKMEDEIDEKDHYNVEQTPQRVEPQLGLVDPFGHLPVVHAIRQLAGQIAVHHHQDDAVGHQCEPNGEED